MDVCTRGFHVMLPCDSDSLSNHIVSTDANRSQFSNQLPPHNTDTMHTPSHDTDAMHPLSQEADIVNPPTTSPASQLNRMVMKRLQKALEADPEVDLTTKIPSSYASRLADRKSEGS